MILDWHSLQGKMAQDAARANLEKGMALLLGASAKALARIEEMNDTERALERFKKAETLMWGHLVLFPWWGDRHIN